MSEAAVALAGLAAAGEHCRLGAAQHFRGGPDDCRGARGALPAAGQAAAAGPVAAAATFMQLSGPGIGFRV